MRHPVRKSDYPVWMKSIRACIICKAPLQGRQRRFCGRTCKNLDTNHRHQNYLAQQARGLRRKFDLVQAAGGRCSRCGYAVTLAALTWHHTDPRSKAIQLDLRNLSNRSERDITHELGKCVLLCANCHAETHSPDMRLDRLAKRLAKQAKA